MPPRTLLSLYGREPAVPSLADNALVLIDYQNDYLKGPLQLPDAAPAIAAAERVLTAARVKGSRIVHILQRGSAGGLFDRAGWGGAPIEMLAPLPGETVIEKKWPSGFVETDLAERLGGAGTSVIFMGFMTHMCVSTTVRDALDYGYGATVVADACAARDLPGPSGIVVARLVHEANLAALGDRFAGIFTAAEILGESLPR